MIHGTIAGNIGRDAETRQAGSDTVTAFSVASSTKRKGEDVTTWVVCQIWGKRGEALKPYLIKGAALTVVGELSQRAYEQNGVQRTSLECRVADVKLQGNKREPSTQQASGHTTPTRSTAPKQAQFDDSVGDDEIPF